MKTVVVCVLLFVGGCVFRPTPSQERAHVEIDKVACTFDTTYSYGRPLTDVELLCLHDVDIVYVPRRDLESKCDLHHDPRRRELMGCYNAGVIYISKSLLPTNEILTLRHEVGHHLLRCADYEDLNHADEIFGGTDHVTDGISVIATECE